MSTDPIRLNNGTRNRAEEETPGAVLNNQTRLAAKGATQLQTNDDGNIGAIGMGFLARRGVSAPLKLGE